MILYPSANISVSGNVTLYANGNLQGAGNTSLHILDNGGLLSANFIGGPDFSIASFTGTSGAGISLLGNDTLHVNGPLSIAANTTIFLDGAFSTPRPLITYSTFTGPASSISIGGGLAGTAYTALNDAANHTITFSTLSVGRHAEVALQGAPGPGGPSFGVVGGGDLTDVSQVLFFNSISSNVTYYRYSGSSYTPLVTNGESNPGPSGGSITSLLNYLPYLNASGQTAFLANLTGTTDGSNQALFLADGNSTTELLHNNQTLPAGGGALSFPSSPFLERLNNAGQVAIILQTSGASDASPAGVFRVDTSSITTIARQSQPAPGHGGIFSNISLDFYSQINNSGQVAFFSNVSGTSDGSTSGIFRGDGHSLVQLVNNKTPAPGPGGGTVSPQADFTFNDAGQVVYDASLSGTSDGSAEGYFRSDSNSTVVIARQKETAPGPGGGTFDFLGTITSPLVNNAGQVAFGSTIVNATNNSDRGIFRSDGSSLIPIVRQYQVLPGIGTAYFVPGEYASNAIGPGGQVAFFIHIINSPAHNAGDIALVMSDGQDYILVAVAGQTLITSQEPLSISSWPAGVSVNSFGQVVVDFELQNITRSDVTLFTPTLHWRSATPGSWDTATNWTLRPLPRRRPRCRHRSRLPAPLSTAPPTTPPSTPSPSAPPPSLQASNSPPATSNSTTPSPSPEPPALDQRLQPQWPKTRHRNHTATKATTLATLRDQIAFGKNHTTGITTTRPPRHHGPRTHRQCHHQLLHLRRPPRRCQRPPPFPRTPRRHQPRRPRRSLRPLRRPQ